MTKKVPKFMILKHAHHRVPVLNEPSIPVEVEDLSEKTNPEWHNGTFKSLTEETSVIDMNALAMFWDREKTPLSGQSASIAEDIKKDQEPTLEVDDDVFDAKLFNED